MVVQCEAAGLHKADKTRVSVCRYSTKQLRSARRYDRGFADRPVVLLVTLGDRFGMGSGSWSR